MLRNAKRAANIGKSSRYAERATSTRKSPIAMNSVLWLPRTPGQSAVVFIGGPDSGCPLPRVPSVPHAR